MEIPVTIYVAIGVITAALLAGYFSFTSMLIAKDQKTTEFRHESISQLRAEVAKFISNVSVFTSMAIYISESGTIDFDEFLSDNVGLIKDLQESYASIRMRVNPNEDHDFLIKLDQLYAYVSGGFTDFTLDEVNIAEEALSVVTQRLLKREWNRVKTGERLYNMVKLGSFGLLITLFTLLVVYVGYVLPT
ncbi:hypothetical protein AB0559_004552 [Vibrio parahaemolyticus]|nr:MULTISPECIES: hypothetical protein [Vibrio harveyi group]EHH2570984.1 hypothetical protein [Vibrio parahaemolyticus]EJG0880281.1 hypothetical protein [Vibrio parahaemolyticus]MBE4186946.1 hypothetical protein [Vibrio parahaemolyticus]MDG2663693.1 hypothetical protein [Vibrio parahaemolyticus]TOJ75947.1 hypothetical protein CGI31_23470 [Vibrio parahaemolyticus]